MNIVRDVEKNVLLMVDDSYDASNKLCFNFREKMLMNNRPAGILEMKVYVTDNRKNYEFDTSGLGNLDSLFKDRVANSTRVGSIFKGLAETIINSQKYMLEENDFLIGSEYVFLDEEDRTYMAYCPGYGKTLREQIGQLAEYFMNRIDYHDQKAVLMTYTIYMKCREEGFSIGDILKVVEKDVAEGNEGNKGNEIERFDKLIDHIPLTALEESKAIKSRREGGGKGVVWKVDKRIVVLAFAIPIVLICAAFCLKVLESPDGRVDPVKILALLILGAGVALYVVKKYGIKFAEKGRGEETEEPTELLYHNFDGDDATELLFDGKKPSGKRDCVVLESEGLPTIRITDFPFYIGKDSGRVDFHLDYHGVSRRHVKIDRDGPGYIIIDLSSTNGTYVNGRRLEPNMPSSIVSGDEVCIGVCTYIVNVVTL